eukprot:1719028-Lingulodinium_polyedra.AAC.1
MHEEMSHASGHGCGRVSADGLYGGKPRQPAKSLAHLAEEADFPLIADGDGLAGLREVDHGRREPDEGRL